MIEAIIVTIEKSSFLRKQRTHPTRSLLPLFLRSMMTAWQFSSWSCHCTRNTTCSCASSVWWSGVVVSTLALINEVNLRRTRLVLRWVTVSGSIPGAGHLFQYVTNQPPKANSAFHPSGVGKWVPAGKAKAGMVHSDSGWTRGVQVKPWEPLRTRAIPERLRGAFTMRSYTNPRLPSSSITGGVAK